MTAASPAGAEGLARRVGVYRFSRAAVMKRSTSLGGQVLARAALAVGHLSPRDCPIFRSWRDSLRVIERRVSHVSDCPIVGSKWDSSRACYALSQSRAAARQRTP